MAIQPRLGDDPTATGKVPAKLVEAFRQEAPPGRERALMVATEVRTLVENVDREMERLGELIVDLDNETDLAWMVSKVRRGLLTSLPRGQLERLANALRSG